MAPDPADMATTMAPDSASASAATTGLPAATAGQPFANSQTHPDRSIAGRDTTGLKNMQQLIQLRWFAVIGQVVTIAVVHLGFNITLPLQPMLVALAGLVAFNLFSQVHWRGRAQVSNQALFIALLVDVGTLTVQLYLSGGATNPFVSLYLLQVILSAVLLEPRSTWTMLAITLACFTGLTLFHLPLPLPMEHGPSLASPYLQGLLLCFVLNAMLLAVFITRIHHNLRTRDARLADLRQRAAEEEHIVRMGLLASGAAHELGTPLATLSVILGDWRHMPPFAQNPELLQEIDEMQTQLRRCKTIVSGILLSAGEARGESPVETTLTEFLDTLLSEWRSTRPAVRLSYFNRVHQELRIVSDSALKQMVCNVLDNALEASPLWVGFEVALDGQVLVLTVLDTGPGFPPEMLAQIGKPYQSSKGRPGGGLGLFLSFNVARTLGGSVSAGNRARGGAVVTMRLPLAAITLAEEDPEDTSPNVH